MPYRATLPVRSSFVNLLSHYIACGFLGPVLHQKRSAHGKTPIHSAIPMTYEKMIAA